MTHMMDPSAEQWSLIWASIQPETIAKILAKEDCLLSQEGCSVIQWISAYVKMDKSTETQILVHAMLLWNAFIEKDIVGTVRNEPIDPEKDCVLSFLLVPIACFSIACKLCGGHQSVQPTISFLVKAAVEIAVIHYNFDKKQYTWKTRAQAKCDLRSVEVLVLQTFDWNVYMLEEIDVALKRVGIDESGLRIVKQSC
jgi:hypothetical protein